MDASTLFIETDRPPVRPEADRVLIFANPIAGRGAGATIARNLEAVLRDQQIPVHCFLENPRALTAADLGKPAKAIIVIGGDGTLRAVIGRLVQTQRLAPILPIPLGTANLVSMHLGFRWKMSTLDEQVRQAVGRCRVRMLDAGQANGQAFMLMAGVGFDAEVIHQLDRRRRGPIQLWDYVLPTLMSFLNYRPAPLRVELDGEEVFPEEEAVAFVGNFPEYGVGFPILLHARDNDGLLDVCVMPCRSRVDLVRLASLVAHGEHLQAEGVVYRRGRHVRISSPAPVPVQLDGDSAGTTPLSVELLPVKVPFIVP